MTFADLSPVANHLWQSSLCAAAAWLLTLTLRRNRAAVRYSIWLAASVKFLIPFSLLVSAGAQLGWRTAPPIAQPRFSFAIEQISRPFAAPLPAVARTSAPSSPNVLSTLVLTVWCCGFTFALASWFRSWRRVQAIRRSAIPLDLNLPIQVLSSPARLEPGVFGIRKPALLLPDGITERLTMPELEAVLAHELCHVRRRDNLTATIHMAVEAIFWFHPLVWWIRERLVQERERACDEAVLGAANDPQIYAEGILNICRHYLEAPLVCVSGVTGSDLKKRIEAILSNRRALRLTYSRKFLLAGALLAALAGPVAIGIVDAPSARAQSQAAGRPDFDVASVKVFQPGSAPEDRRITPSHGNLTIRQQTLRECIAWAYGLRNADEIEGPTWIESAEFDVDAKAADSTGVEQLRLMLQSLLEKRFHLSIHRKTEQRPAYALVVGKNGPRMQEVQTGPVKGMHLGGIEGGFMSIQMVNTMAKLAEILPIYLGRPVLDKTGLTGVYTIKLRIEMDDPHARLPQPGQVFDGFGLTSGIFPAVEELGLKLVSEKGPAEILVVDHVEHPTEN